MSVAAVPNPSEHKQGLSRRTTKLVARVCLVLPKQFGLQFHVSWLVYAVHIAEGSRDAEIGADWTQCLVNIIYILGLSVKSGVINTSIVDAVFFTTCDADLHLKPETERSHALEVLSTGLDVLYLGLFREVKHVRGEQWLLVRFEVFFVRCEHAIKPGEELLSTVITVQDNWTIGMD